MDEKRLKQANEALQSIKSLECRIKTVSDLLKEKEYEEAATSAAYCYEVAFSDIFERAAKEWVEKTEAHLELLRESFKEL